MKKNLTFILMIALLTIIPISAHAYEDNMDGIGITLYTNDMDNSNIENEISKILESIDENDSSSINKSITELIKLQDENNLITFEDDLINTTWDIPSSTIQKMKMNNQINTNNNIMSIEDTENEINLNASKIRRLDSVEKHVGAKIFGIKGDIVAKIKCTVEWWYWSDTGHITNVLPKTTFTTYHSSKCTIISSNGSFTSGNQQYNHNVKVRVDYLTNSIFSRYTFTDLSFNIYRGTITNTSIAE